MHETTFSLHEVFTCAHLKFTVYGHKQRDIHTISTNAVMLVWGSLRLTPITVISHPCLYMFVNSKWSQVRKVTEGLAKTLHAYADDMEQSAKRSEEKHKSTTSSRSHDIDTQSHDIRYR